MSYPPIDRYQEKLEKYYEYSKAGIVEGVVRYSHRQRLDAISTLIDNIENKMILDAGCGCGANVIRFAKKGAKVIGVDIGEKEIEKVDKWHKEEDLVEEVTLIHACSDKRLTF